MPAPVGRTRVLCVYRQERKRSDGWEAIRRDVSAAYDDSKQLVIAGDFNAYDSRWSGPDAHSRGFGSKLGSLCDDLGLTVLNSEYGGPVATHEQGGVLDLFITSSPHIFQSLAVHSGAPDAAPPLPLPPSDHFPLTATLVGKGARNGARVGKRPVTQRWLTHKADLDSYHRLLSDTSAISTLLDSTFSSPSTLQQKADAAISAFYNFVLSAAELAIPRAQLHPDSKPYWNGSSESLKAALHELRRAQRQHYGKSREQRTPDSARAVKEARAAFKAAQADAQARYDERLTDPAGGLNWSEWRRRTHPKSTVPSDVADLAGNKPSSLAESLNNLGAHFSAVCSPLADPMASDADRAFHERIEKDVAAYDEIARSKLPACDDHITYEELLPLAQHIRLRTALGPDGIHPWLIGHAPEPAIRVLARVFDFLWVNGVLPTQWKVANLFVLYKGAGDRSRADSYRPISLTSVVCKLYERLILARMVASFHLDPAQAGFRAGFSCLDQVYQVVDRVYDAFDRLSEVDYAFLDLSKAFDRVWHAGLLHKLRVRGASPQMWLFWRSFLSGRSFRVAQGGCFSDSFPVTAGVPQGAVVSPMAFCLFIDDLPAICRKTGAEVHLFADDIAARGTSPLPGIAQQQLALALGKMHFWTLRWRLSFNVPKSVCVRFTKRKRDCAPGPDRLPYRLGGKPLAFVKSFPYLGVVLSSNLSWRDHYKRVLKKVSSSCRLISKTLAFQGCRLPLVRTAVLAIPVAQIAYGLAFWQPTLEEACKLEGLIAAPLRSTLGLPLSTRRLNLFAECAILPLEVLRAKILAATGIRYWGTVSKLALGPQRQPHPMVATWNGTLHRRRPAAPSLADTRLPLRVLAAVSFLGIEIDGSKLDLKRAALTVAFSQAVPVLPSGDRKADDSGLDNSGPGSAPVSHLARWKRKAGVSEYLQTDSRQVACLRARLRLDRSSLAESLFRRRDPRSPFCCHCSPEPDGGKAEETLEHTLLRCSAYAGPRQALQLRLANRFPLDCNTILAGPLPGVSPRASEEVLKATADFLLDVFRIRGQL